MESRRSQPLSKSGRKSRNTRRSRRRPLRFEGLEERRVLAVFHVTADVEDGAASSLRQAIIQANENQEDDEIHLAEGLYDLTLTGTAGDDHALGDLDFTEIGTGITLIGAGSGRSIIDATNLSDRLLDVTDGVNVVLQGVTIRNGRTASEGGGIRNLGQLEIHDSEITANVGSIGGGIYNAGSLIISNSQVIGNIASDGGGIFNFEGDAEVIASEIADNSADGSRGEVSAEPLIVAGHGGGLLNVAGSVAITETRVRGNTASYQGGGIGTAGGEMRILKSSVWQNSARMGGGVSTLLEMLGEAATTGDYRWPSEPATLHIEHSTVNDNRASIWGGGISTNAGSQVEILQSTISNNQAGDVEGPGSQGGGIFLGGANSLVKILHSTITRNSAQSGAGLFHNHFPTVQIGNSIIAENSVLDTGAIIDIDSSPDPNGRRFESLGNNLIGNIGPYSLGFAAGVRNHIVGGQQSPPVNSMLQPLYDAGVATGLYVPASCSPAIAIEAGATVSVQPNSSSTLHCHGAAVADWYTVAAGDFELPVTTNDSSGSEEQPVITWLGEPSHGGTLSVSADGKGVHYSPAPGFLGLETFAYAIEGGDGQSAHAVVTVQVLGAPRAVPDEQVVERDSADNSIDVLANDPTIGHYVGVNPIVSATNGQAGGSVQIAADGRSVRYTPPVGFVGEDTFEYSLLGGRSSVVRVRVYDPEAPTVAPNHRYTVFATPEGAGDLCNPEDANCPLIDIHDAWNLPVLNNRTHGSVETDLMRIESVSDADQGGYAEIDRNLREQWIQYRPRPGFVGTETFTYVTRDREGRTSTGTVTVDVIPQRTLARVRLEATNAAGIPISSVQPGETFQIRVMAQDLRSSDDIELNDMSVLRTGYWWYTGTLRAVQSAAIRVGFDPADAVTAGEPQFGTPYASSEFHLSDPVVTEANNSIDLAAEAVWVRDIGSEDVLFASIPFTATAPGPLTFTLNPTGGIALATFGNIADSAVEFEGTSLTVRSLDQNPNLREDVNNDGVLTPHDALILINDLNENGGRQLVTGEGEPGGAEQSTKSYYPDVNSDGWLTPGDVMVIFNRLNRVTESASAEAEAADVVLSLPVREEHSAADRATAVRRDAHDASSGQRPNLVPLSPVESARAKQSELLDAVFSETADEPEHDLFAGSTLSDAWFDELASDPFAVR